jgi:hypothetical protein
MIFAGTVSTLGEVCAFVASVAQIRSRGFSRSGLRYPTIFQDNRETINDPDLIQPQQQVKVPPDGGAWRGGASGLALWLAEKELEQLQESSNHRYE